MHNEYELLDSGEGRKLERFGGVILSRPCDQASWGQQKPEMWARAAASFDRERGWQTCADAELPLPWVVTINDIAVRLELTPAGHLGVFPETRHLWDWITDTLRTPNAEDVEVLNLFAYSGGATLAAARAGCSVCHVDSSRSMVTRARENAGLNQLDAAPIRWIVEDVGKFLDREIRRGRKYDAIMLDPPSFGRGTKGEQYRIDRDLDSTLRQCSALLNDEPAFVLLTSHTRGVTTVQLESLMGQALGSGDIACGEMQLTGASDVRPVNDGVWVRWTLHRPNDREGRDA
ncbi:MAG TPA: class I SAM-dependent methyltransferase [Coriobacteriia bacterium]|nr:class I SAM-dependent methyltransferase [Coriobacteriia bacterium]